MNIQKYNYRIIICLLTILALISQSFAQEGKNRTRSAKLYPGAAAAISKGLAHIQSTQAPDGSWGAKHKAADTSVALMAFMLQGHVPGRGKYGRTMDKAISWLVKKGQSQGGYIGGDKAGMYEHGLAVLALSEAWGQSKNPKLREVLRSAVDIILRAQNPAGGWRYSPEPKDADISMTVMHCVALNSAKESGIAVPDNVIQNAAKYVKACQVNNGGFAYTAKTNGGDDGDDFPRSAGGVMALIMCGDRKSNATKRGIAYLKSFPEARKFSTSLNYFHYSHYYASQVMYQTGDANFNAWYPKVSRLILKNHKDGNWGDIYKTSMSILILGVPYRYLPIYQR